MNRSKSGDEVIEYFARDKEQVNMPQIRVIKKKQTVEPQVTEPVREVVAINHRVVIINEGEKQKWSAWFEDMPHVKSSGKSATSAIGHLIFYRGVEVGFKVINPARLAKLAAKEAAREVTAMNTRT